MPLSRAARTRFSLSAFMTPIDTTGRLTPVFPSRRRMISAFPAGSGRPAFRALPPESEAALSPVNPINPLFKKSRRSITLLFSVIVDLPCARIRRRRMEEPSGLSSY